MKSKPYEQLISALEAIDTQSANVVPSNFAPTIDEAVVFSDYLQGSTYGNVTQFPLLLGNFDFEASLFRALDDLKKYIFPGILLGGFQLPGLRLPVLDNANIFANNKNPTWRYRWFGAFMNTEITTVPFSGTWHAGELAILFGNASPASSGIPNSTAAEVFLSIKVSHIGLTKF
ncbi:hypothetical protein BGW36DRAFT_433331 [Talaromyces proteolyticus]|uniref:Carboxylesterase type B domain-containing protein n=1 Tax=Talaromyces proteolyticus TaxID=1131652 RepID=A0AAD4PRN6_9EURO|nr:uncharacterized protein BGW36DRAFT_433331 [Talaromyces proteolyticus]KAH8689324.1 hypothetical protein BGW36DRAFT_433331 [Talaromyces proteolyticus]